MPTFPTLLAAAALAVLPSFTAARDAPRAVGRGMAFWKPVIESCEVPTGQSAAALVGEALELLGHPDPAWRDEVGYGVVAACVYGRRALGPAERREVVARLTANLRRGVGEAGTGSVLLRSFSALDLSVLAALEGVDPALDEPGYRALLDAALAYLRDERDLRAIEPRTGWIHATAHTADLLTFLARDRRFGPTDQTRLLDGVWTRLTAPGTPVFTHAEEERLAAAVVTVLRREDLDAAALDAWLARFPALEREVWARTPPDPARLDAAQNARSHLRAVYVLASLPPRVTPPGSTPDPAAARAKVLEALGAIRR